MSSVRKPNPSYSSTKIRDTLPHNDYRQPYSAELPIVVMAADRGRTVCAIERLPGWLHFDAYSLVISGIPSALGTVRIKASATNGKDIVSYLFQLGISEPVSRFGYVDPDTGEWVDRPEELGSVEVSLDEAHPRDKSTAQRIINGALNLHAAGRISDAELIAATRFHDDWIRGTGHPLRASEIRFLGVSPGGASASDGIATSTLDAQTRYREACAEIGVGSTDRLMLFAVAGHSISATASLIAADHASRAADRLTRGLHKLCTPTRQDLSGLLVGDLERLGAHYQKVDSAPDARRRKLVNDGRS